MKWKSTRSIVFCALFASQLASPLAIASDETPNIDWQEKYLETQVELDRATGLIETLQLEMRLFNAYKQLVQVENVNAASAESQASLNEYKKLNKKSEEKSEEKK